MFHHSLSSLRYNGHTKVLPQFIFYFLFLENFYILNIAKKYIASEIKQVYSI